GWNVGRDVTGLRFDERQRGQRATAVLVIQLCCALEQAAVQEEHVTRERLAARRAAEQQRDLTIRRSVLREVVVYAQRVPPAIAKKLAHRTTGVGSQVLHGRRNG